METAQDRPIRKGRFPCDVCRFIKTDHVIVYSADDFKRVVRRGLLPPKTSRQDLALEARPPKRDMFGRHVTVISTDVDALRRSVTAVEEQVAVQKWKNAAKQRDTEALLCPICDENAGKYDGPSFIERIAKKFKK